MLNSYWSTATFGYYSLTKKEDVLCLVRIGAVTLSALYDGR